MSDTLVWIYYMKVRHRLALPLLRECVRKVPDHAICHYHLGMVELAGGTRAMPSRNWIWHCG
jgi:hypothetical protein